jgi:PTS system fructose-specific IIC component/PTS system nitrogen regulatory IIA component
MLLQQIFSPARIKTDLESEDKDEVFEELVDVLARDGGKNYPRAEVLAALRGREAKMSTGIKKGIAIPHGKAAGVPGISGALGISRKGIDYDSLDGEPVHIVFMIVSSTKESEFHLQALKGLARLLDDSEFYLSLARASTSSEVFSIIKNFEDLVSLQP